MGVITLAVRYRGQGGRLIQVLRRDGGVYYLSLLGMLWSLFPRDYLAIYGRFLQQSDWPRPLCALLQWFRYVTGVTITLAMHLHPPKVSALDGSPAYL
jgi:hypothetical protein